MTTAKTAIVTGSTSGIGLGIARVLAGTGANIVLNGFGDAKEIEGIVDGIRSEHNVGVIHDGADMSKPAEIDRMVEHARSEFGHVDILVNNAASAVSTVQLIDSADESTVRQRI